MFRTEGRPSFRTAPWSGSNSDSTHSDIDAMPVTSVRPGDSHLEEDAGDFKPSRIDCCRSAHLKKCTRDESQRVKFLCLLFLSWWVSIGNRCYQTRILVWNLLSLKKRHSCTTRGKRIRTQPYAAKVGTQKPMHHCDLCLCLF